MKFCDRLKLAREHAGLTQQQLIDRLPLKSDGKPLMAQPNLAKMEKSENAKGSIYSVFIAEACGVNPKWLANEIGGMLDTNNVYENSPEAQVLIAMQNMDAQTKYQVVKISNSLVEPKANGTSHK